MENLSSAGRNNGEVDLHGGRRNDEVEETVEIVTLKEFSQLLVKRPKKLCLGSRKRRQIQKVPLQVRLRRQHSEHLYDPMMVSLGPYHHGKQELSRAEEFKYLCLDWFVRGDEEKKVIFYNKVVEKIEIIRDCYAEVTIVEKYDGKALALMMLLDACIIINFMHNCLHMNGNNYLDWQNCLGSGSILFMVRDMILMENQIPFQVLKLLISLRYEKEEAEGFVEKFLSYFMNIERHHSEIPGENEDPPVHFLEACWRVKTKEHNSEHERLDSKFQLATFLLREEKNDITNISYVPRSVMDLKSKGIHFRASSFPSLMSIRFSSHAFSGELQLPVRIVSDLVPVFLANMIAYEISPNSNVSHIVLSYVIFMKSLIQSTEDVKELQEKGILLNSFANLEKVVKLYKEIDTFGLRRQDIFMDVKQKVEEHCNSKAKKWIADLISTRFRSPWTAIALFAAVFLLCFTFLQSFFTIRSVKWNNP